MEEELCPYCGSSYIGPPYKWPNNVWIRSCDQCGNSWGVDDPSEVTALIAADEEVAACQHCGSTENLDSDKLCPDCARAQQRYDNGRCPRCEAPSPGSRPCYDC